jgi:hypothetical protein
MFDSYVPAILFPRNAGSIPACRVSDNPIWDIPKRAVAHQAMPKSLSNREYRAMIDALVARWQAAGLNQVGMAAKLAQPQSYISKIERFERRLDILEFSQLAEALGEEPGRLLTEIVPVTDSEGRKTR